MSDTIVVALITFASGAIGAVVGAVSSILMTKYNAQKEWASSFHKSRSDSYSHLLDCAVYYEKDFNNIAKLADLFSAINAAELVASDKTRSAISAFKERMLAKDFRSATFVEARSQMISAMQSDLLIIPSLKVRKQRGCRG